MLDEQRRKRPEEAGRRFRETQRTRDMAAAEIGSPYSATCSTAASQWFGESPRLHTNHRRLVKWQARAGTVAITDVPRQNGLHSLQIQRPRMLPRRTTAPEVQSLRSDLHQDS